MFATEFKAFRSSDVTTVDVGAATTDAATDAGAGVDAGTAAAAAVVVVVVVTGDFLRRVT